MEPNQDRARLRVASGSSGARTPSPLTKIGDSLKRAWKGKEKEYNIHLDSTPNRPATAPSGSSSRISVPAPREWQSTTDLWELARLQVIDDTNLDEAIKAELRTESCKSNPSEVIRAAENAKNHYQGEQRTYTRSSGDKKTYQDTVNKILQTAGCFGDLVGAATALDPTNHASMVWGGVKVFLKVILYP